MRNRTVRILQFADMVDMGGIPVRQPLPTNRIGQIDPFLLLHHHAGKIDAGLRPQDVGVGPHPHRGFSPVTFIFKGDVHHRDSRGHSQVVKAGGVQWMDAGMGLMHSERPSEELAANGGEQEIIQLWVNTPHAHKMDQPNYQALQKEDIPAFQSDAGEGRISVVAGDMHHIHGPANTKLDLILLRADLEAGAKHTFQIPEKYHLLLYITEGEIHIDQYGKVEALNMVVFKEDGDAITVTAEQKSTFVVLAGVPLNEKVEQYGPFVMSSQTEIMQAIRDYQLGKMGILIEEF